MINKRRHSRGFTLIEVLIVIVLLGILAVVVLSAINPIEQLKKARDSGRKNDSSELLGGLERYYASYSSYPWGDETPDGLPANDESIGLDSLVSSGELKSQFTSRATIAELCVSASPTGQVSVCFVPESLNGQTGGLGQLMSAPNNSGPIASCGSEDGGGFSYTPGCADSGCYVCVPQ